MSLTEFPRPGLGKAYFLITSEIPIIHDPDVMDF